MNTNQKKKLSLGEKAAYGLGAVGKDMVYMLSASFILYYYQDILGVSAIAMGIILLVARVFDAVNDPVMGVIVAKTKTRFGKFRPWLFIGTLTNAVVLVLMFAAPPALSGSGLIAYAAITYILWGVTYTMMDVPFWSMVPAFTEGGKDRENMSALGRTCAGIGSALITVITVAVVALLGKFAAGEGAPSNIVEREGFKYFALIVAILFFVFILFTVLKIKEKPVTDMQTVSIKEMFKALIKNDQAMAIIITLILVNVAVYTTSNLLIYFFKYDFGGEGWKGDYTLFTAFGGAIQVLSMMILFPLMRKFISAFRLFFVALISAIIGYVLMIIISFTAMNNVFIFFIPAFFIFAAVGILNVLLTAFLANTCDYGEIKNGRRDESVIFSMQTFVVKLSSGVAALIASLCLAANAIESDENITVVLSDSSVIGLRMTMSLIPIAVIIAAFFFFKSTYTLTDEKVAENTEILRNKSNA